jgi:hypothetical protein
VHHFHGLVLDAYRSLVGLEPAGDALRVVPTEAVG